VREWQRQGLLKLKQESETRGLTVKEMMAADGQECKIRGKRGANLGRLTVGTYWTVPVIVPGMKRPHDL